MLKQYTLLASLLAGTSTIYAQTPLEGHLFNRSREPIPSGTVTVKNSKSVTSSDATGYFKFNGITAQKITLNISAVGYRSLTKVIAMDTIKSPVQIQLEEDNLNLDEVVVSATRYGVKRKDAPVVVNVIGPKLFNATQSVAMSETLNYQPGVRVENNCQNCGFSQVRLNGLEGPYSQILINSRAVFSALNSVYGLDQIPTSMIDRIEVVRSGGSALFGANAIAGTINIITKDPVENDWQVKSTNSLIGGKSWDNTVDFNTSLVAEDLKTGATFYGMHRNRQSYDANGDGFSEITKLRNTTFGTKVFYKPSDLDKITVDFSTVNEFRRGGDQLDKVPHLTQITEQLQTSSVVGGITYDHYSEDYKHKLSAYGSVQKTVRDSYYGGLGGGSTLADSTLASNAYGKTDDIALVAGSQYTYNFERDVFTAGVEFSYNDTQDEIAGYSRTIDQRSKGLGSYAQYEWKPFATLKTLIGARYDYTYVDGKYSLAGINRNSDQRFGTFSPRLTILYDISKDLQFRGGYARGFRAPQAFNEDMHVTSIGGNQVFVLIGENLKTEYSNAYTGSFSYNKNFGNVQTSMLVEGFYTDLNNQFVNVMASEKDGLIIQEMQNGEGARVYGLNIEINVAPSSWLSFQAGGTAQRSRYKREQLIYEGETESQDIWTKKYVRTPNIYGYMNSNLKATKRLAVDLTGVYTGKMIVPHIQDDIMTLKDARDFVELNLRLGYTLPIHKHFSIEIFGGVQNMFNAFQKDFDKGPLRDSDYIYGPTRPRTYTFGLRVGHFH
ncbi:TonB-dependent receptor [Sphingobacterium thalpophilum]|uniref:TonB-dependent receptor n=1 Tax=Sphingobacterium thalpophilum TaxID=259 RepID=UPI0024A75A8E|nr:TonB-dependent receptor [Sphingobacterium thalpophilum]